MDVMSKSVDDRALAEEARALLAATAEADGEKVARARQRLAWVIGKAKEACDHRKEKTRGGVQAADESVRQRSDMAIGIASGFGALPGSLGARRNRD